MSRRAVATDCDHGSASAPLGPRTLSFETLMLCVGTWHDWNHECGISSQDLPLNPSLTSPAPHHKIRRRKPVNTSERRGDGGDVSQPLPENSDLVMLDTRTGWPTGPTNRPLTALVLNGLPVLPAGLAEKREPSTLPNLVKPNKLSKTTWDTSG